jgi:hypothetical protein
MPALVFLLSKLSILIKAIIPYLYLEYPFTCLVQNYLKSVILT